MEKKPVSHIIKGVIIAAILIALDLLSSASFLKNVPWYAYVPTIVLLLASILNVIHYCSQLNANVKFGDAFAFGFKTAAIVALVMVAYTFISLKYIHPDYKEKAYELALKGFQEQPNIMPEEAKTQAKAYSDNYIMTNISLALMSTLIVSAIGSAIGAALAKRNQ
jgi:hypothetical protein